jgi:hypothetical protein
MDIGDVSFQPGEDDMLRQLFAGGDEARRLSKHKRPNRAKAKAKARVIRPAFARQRCERSAPAPRQVCLESAEQRLLLREARKWTTSRASGRPPRTFGKPSASRPETPKFPLR